MNTIFGLTTHPDASIDTEFAVDTLIDMMEDDVESTPSLYSVTHPNDWKDV